MFSLCLSGDSWMFVSQSSGRWWFSSWRSVEITNAAQSVWWKQHRWDSTEPSRTSPRFMKHHWFLMICLVTGSYTDSSGLTYVRNHVAKFISLRDDGIVSSPEHIFISCGSQRGLMVCFTFIYSSYSISIYCNRYKRVFDFIIRSWWDYCVSQRAGVQLWSQTPHLSTSLAS